MICFIYFGKRLGEEDKEQLQELENKELVTVGE